jgi:hypothetical protein
VKNALTEKNHLLVRVSVAISTNVTQIHVNTTVSVPNQERMLLYYLVNIIANVQLIIQAASVKLRNPVQFPPARMAGIALRYSILPICAPAHQALME